MLRSHPALLLTTALLTACATRPSHLANDPDWHANNLVLVKSVRIPDRTWLPWFTRWAEHCWIDYKLDGEWYRAEWNKHSEAEASSIDDDWARADERWERDVAVHEVARGERARAIGQQLAPLAAAYPCDGCYRAWPGPNSNSFVEHLAREACLSAVLPPTAIGKDFTTWLHVGITTSGTGVEVETLPIGAQLGLFEGLELHVLGLSAGVGIWPPSITLPFLPKIPGGWFGW